jgi:hypothetical protein
MEISKSQPAPGPADYERKQTLVNAERFTTAELKEYERKILAADERISEIECRLFVELRSGIAAKRCDYAGPAPPSRNSTCSPLSQSWPPTATTRARNSMTVASC